MFSCLILCHQSTSSPSLTPPCSPPSVSQPLPRLLMRKAVGWKCYALGAASARNSARIVWEGRQTWCSPTWLCMEQQKREAVQRGGEGCNNKKKTSVVAVIHSQGSQLSRNHGNVSHWWDFFICHLQGQSSRSRWNGWHSRNATLKGREGGKGRVDWQNALRKQRKLSDFPFL